jgi:hypothetical protein
MLQPGLRFRQAEQPKLYDHTGDEITRDEVEERGFYLLTEASPRSRGFEPLSIEITRYGCVA